MSQLSLDPGSLTSLREGVDLRHLAPSLAQRAAAEARQITARVARERGKGVRRFDLFERQVRVVYGLI